MFKSSILLESHDASNISYEDNSIGSYTENILELNDQLHEIDTNEKINYYRALKEDSLGESTDLILRENIISSLKEALTKAIDAVIDFIKRFVNYIRKLYSTKLKANFEEFKKSDPDAQARRMDRMNARRIYKFFYYPNLNDIDDNTCFRAVQNIVNNIDGICRGSITDYTVTPSSLEIAFSTLARLALKNRSRSEFAGSCKTFDKFKELVGADIVYIEEKEATYGELYDFHKTRGAVSLQVDSIVSKKLANITSELERCKNNIQHATEIDESQRNNLNALVGQINTIVAAWTWYLNLICNMEVRCVEYISRARDAVMNESGSIHGETFNGDTLFANEDMRDFGSTEWLDLSLKAEVCEMRYQMLETTRRIAVNEAIIFASNDINKFAQLISMREAQEKKLTANFQTILQKIRELIQQFLAKLKDTFNSNTLFIKKYKVAIDKPFAFRDVSSTGNILAGMARVQQAIRIVPFDYESMKESLSSKEEFFKKHIMSSLNAASPISKRNTEWKDGMKITDYCKLYFGYGMPEEQYPKCVYTNDELNTNKNTILEFLNNSNKITNSINSEIRALDIESKKAASFTANPTNNTSAESQNTNNSNANTQQQSATTSGDASKQESYYSVLYDTWFTEAEINEDENTKKENNSEAANNSNKTSDQSAAFKIYIDCYKDVITSKLTAVEFIGKELMQIIRAHAIANMTKEERESYNQYKNNGEQNTNQGAAATQN